MAGRRGGRRPAGRVVEHPPASSGSSPCRGAWIEAGGPEPRFALSDKDTSGPTMQGGSTSERWPGSGILRSPSHGRPRRWPTRIEQAVTKVMAYLVENGERAGRTARFLGHVHPHFAEVQHVLAAQVADEARVTPMSSPGERAWTSALRPCPALVVAPRCRPFSTSPTSPSPASCSASSARGDLPGAARVPRTPRSRRVHPGHRQARPSRRSSTCCIRRRPPRTPRWHDRACDPDSPRRSSVATTTFARPRGSTRTSSTASSCSPPAAPPRPRWPRVGPR